MTHAKLRYALPLLAAMFAGCERPSGLAGIDGTGAPIAPIATTRVYGTATALGSVTVNGVRYDTSSAVITIDGRLGVESEIEVGDIVRVTATADPVSARFVASRVTIDDAVEGPITAISAATNTMVVLGQTVHVTDATVFDEAIPESSLQQLEVGAVVEVAGFRASGGDVIATRIEAKPTGGEFETTGIVAILDETGHELLIGGLVVDWTAVTIPAALRPGEVVEIKGSVLLPGGELFATKIERSSIVSGSAGDRVDIEGYVTAFRPGSPESFDVAGLSTRTTSDTVVEGVNLALDARVAIKGSLDPAGTVIASNIAQSVPPRSGPTPPPGVYSIVGQVFEASGGVVASAPVNLWVQTPRLGYSYWWANGALHTNDRGEFTASNLPDSEISIHAGHHAWVQPCAVAVPVPGPGYVQVEVIAGAAFDSPNPPRPQFVSGTTLTGTVFETVNGTRQPVSGALIWAYSRFDVDLASTRSDLQGRFFFCNLPAQVLLLSAKDDYALDYTPVIDTAVAGPIDVELHRK